MPTHWKVIGISRLVSTLRLMKREAPQNVARSLSRSADSVAYRAAESARMLAGNKEARKITDRIDVTTVTGPGGMVEVSIEAGGEAAQTMEVETGFLSNALDAEIDAAVSDAARSVVQV